MNNIKLIGVGGFARVGKDLFVKIASNILAQNGYTTKKFAFADALKNDLDPFLQEKYGISAWTNDPIEKSLIRPLFVAHGCAKRNQTEGKYWVDKVHNLIESYVFTQTHDLKSDLSNVILFVSDVRFVNEAIWTQSLGGRVVHLKKYENILIHLGGGKYENARSYAPAPNEEERTNDPMLQSKVDYFLELEDISSKPETFGNIITEAALLNDSYLNREITLCLKQFPFLNIRTQ